MKKILPLALLIVSSSLIIPQPSYAQSAVVTDVSADSVRLIKAAQDEIQVYKDTANPETACNIYVENVLEKAGYRVEEFVANDLDKSMSTSLPTWKAAQFTTDNPGEDQEVLRSFLNSAPDGTAFLAQWSRVGQGGHVAVVEKVSVDNYMIYQAQHGLSLPYSKPAQIHNLLYPKGAWGDRSHLRLFYE